MSYNILLATANIAYMIFLRLVEQHVLVIKGMTEVCVYISAEIARLLSSIVSTVDGTTTSIKFLLLMDKIGTNYNMIYMQHHQHYKPLNA